MSPKTGAYGLTEVVWLRLLMCGKALPFRLILKRERLRLEQRGA